MMAEEELAEGLSKQTAPVKAVLLDQNALFCGIGNWVADEICFNALIHPGQVAATLTPEQVKELHRAIIEVVST